MKRPVVRWVLFAVGLFMAARAQRLVSTSLKSKNAIIDEQHLVIQQLRSSNPDIARIDESTKRIAYLSESPGRNPSGTQMIFFVVGALVLLLSAASFPGKNKTEKSNSKNDDVGERRASS